MGVSSTLFSFVGDLFLMAILSDFLGVVGLYGAVIVVTVLTLLMELVVVLGWTPSPA